MIEDYNLILLSGGHHLCDRTWTRAANGADQCYKIYLPVAGLAELVMSDGRYNIKAGNVYFISGYGLRRQICDSQMDVYWIHFVPESLYLSYLLDQLGPVHHWPRSSADSSVIVDQDICAMFDNPDGELNRPRSDSPLTTACRIHGFLLGLIARLLDKLEHAALHDFHPEYYQLKPALDYMQEHYREKPALVDIARQVHLAPNYFHRRFVQLFGITPFNYMLAQRLNHARHLLMGTSLNIKEVADAVGYDNPFYFTRLFTKTYGVSPRSFRLQSNRHV